jgi:hypothetical protein
MGKAIGGSLSLAVGIALSLDSQRLDNQRHDAAGGKGLRWTSSRTSYSSMSTIWDSES